MVDKMTKPLVFNYKRYEELRDAYKMLLEENQKLKRENKKLKADVRYLIKNLEISGRTLQKDLPTLAEYLDRYPTMHEYAEGKRINPKMTDLISRAEVIGIIEDYIGKDYMTPMSRLYSVRSELSALPSAELTLQTPQTYGKSINPSYAEKTISAEVIPSHKR